MAENEMTLWSKRHNAAQGNHWVAERKVTDATAQDWLAVFRKDEPGVLFLVAKRKPSERK